MISNKDNKLEESLRQYIQSSNSETHQWTLDADKEAIRQAIGVAFAGTEKVLGEPTWVWGLSHIENLDVKERVHWVRFMMSFPFLDDLRQTNNFQLCSVGDNDKNSTIQSFVSVQEYDVDLKRSIWFAKLRTKIRFVFDSIRLMISYKEEVPTLFQAAERKEVNKQFEGKLGDFETKTHQWHHEVLPTGSHWYVHMVGVNPKCQGQGQGKALMTKLNELADAKGQLMYLEAGDRNRKFYEKMGFEVVRSETLVDPQEKSDVYVMHIMTRQAQKQN